MTTEPLKPMECAHRDLYTQNYPQFLWIDLGKHAAKPFSPTNNSKFAICDKLLQAALGNPSGIRVLPNYLTSP